MYIIYIGFVILAMTTFSCLFLITISSNFRYKCYLTSLRNYKSHDSSSSTCAVNVAIASEIVKPCHLDLSLKSAIFLPLSEESLAMANYDENPFAGDSENPFAVSICRVNKLIRGGIYNLSRLVWSCTFLRSENCNSQFVGECLLSFRIHQWLHIPLMLLVDSKISILLQTKTRLKQAVPQRLFI